MARLLPVIVQSIKPVRCYLSLICVWVSADDCRRRFRRVSPSSHARPLSLSLLLSLALSGMNEEGNSFPCFRCWLLLIMIDESGGVWMRERERERERHWLQSRGTVHSYTHWVSLLRVCMSERERCWMHAVTEKREDYETSKVREMMQWITVNEGEREESKRAYTSIPIPAFLSLSLSHPHTHSLRSSCRQKSSN